MADDYNPSIAELVEALDEFTENLDTVVERSLQQMGRDLERKVRTAGWTNRSYELQRSIFSNVRNNKLTFGMKDYGYYQIFGVIGTKRRGASTLGIVSRQFRGKGPSSKFEYDTANFKHPGLKGYPSTAEYIKDAAELLKFTIEQNIEFTE